MDLSRAVCRGRWPRLWGRSASHRERLRVLLGADGQSGQRQSTDRMPARGSFMARTRLTRAMHMEEGRRPEPLGRARQRGSRKSVTGPLGAVARHQRSERPGSADTRGAAQTEAGAPTRAAGRAVAGSSGPSVVGWRRKLSCSSACAAARPAADGRRRLRPCCTIKRPAHGWLSGGGR